LFPKIYIGIPVSSQKGYY